MHNCYILHSRSVSQSPQKYDYTNLLEIQCESDGYIGYEENVAVRRTKNPHKQRRIPLVRDARAVDNMVEDDFDNGEAL